MRRIWPAACRAALGLGLALIGAQAQAVPTDDATAEGPPLAERSVAASLRQRATLRFERAELRHVFEALARLLSINIVLGRDVDGAMQVTLDARAVPVADMLQAVLLQAHLRARTLDANTLLIHADTPASRSAHDDRALRRFQPRHADAARLAELLRTVLGLKQVQVDGAGGALVVRDTEAALRDAQQLIAANDLPVPEVMVEVEFIEASRSRLRELGLAAPTGLAISLPPQARTLGGLRALGADDLQVSGLQARLAALMQDGHSRVLARPQLRARQREKAQVHVGDRVPMITSQWAGQGTDAGALLAGAVQFLEVGMKLQLQPDIHADRRIALQFQWQVDQVTDTVATAGGQAYRLGTRSVAATVTLDDGQTHVVSMVRSVPARSAAGVPAGELRQDDDERELLLAITPHLVHAPPEDPGRGSALAVGAWPAWDDEPAWQVADAGPAGWLRSEVRGTASPVVPAAAAPVREPEAPPAPGEAPAKPAAPAAQANDAAAASPKDGTTSPPADATPSPALPAPPSPNRMLPGVPLVVPRTMPGRTPMAPPAPPASPVTPTTTPTTTPATEPQPADGLAAKP